MSESINRRRALIVVAAVPAVAAAAGLMGIKVSTLIATPEGEPRVFPVPIEHD